MRIATPLQLAGYSFFLLAKAIKTIDLVGQRQRCFKHGVFPFLENSNKGRDNLKATSFIEVAFIYLNFLIPRKSPSHFQRR